MSKSADLGLVIVNCSMWANRTKFVRRVLAFSIPPYFAVHPDPNAEIDDHECWVVTHIPTGLQAVRGLSESDALACASEMAAILDADMSSSVATEVAAIPELKAIAVRWRERHAHAS